ncbi:MAG TPA: BBP7 family outer membrane beta-barrel protein [Gemmataceae bacterium]
MLKRIAAALVLALFVANLAFAQTPIRSSNGTPSAAPPEDSTAEPMPVFPRDNGTGDRSAFDWSFSADYLLGWVRGNRLPPLITTSPAGTAQAAAGVLGQPGTTVLFGDDKAGGDVRSGFRLGMTALLDDERGWSVNAGFFYLFDQSNSFSANSPQGSPILARPFFNTVTGLPDSQLVAFPGLATGGVSGSFQNNNFAGFNLDIQEALVNTNNLRVQPLFGFRYLQFNDRLGVDTNEIAAGSNLVAPGTQIAASDRFTTRNAFYGADLGVRTEWFFDRLSVELVGILAVGNLRRSVGISGLTQITAPGQTAEELAGGVLALSSNSGVFKSNEWVVAPELGVTLGWYFTPNIQLRLGYTFLLLQDAARAGDQVDQLVNPNLIPPAQAGASTSHPAFQLKTTDIWVQTLSLGMGIRF